MKFKLPPYTIIVAIFILILGMAVMTYYESKMIAKQGEGPNTVVVDQVITTPPLEGCVVTRKTVIIPNISQHRELLITLCPNASTSSTWKSGKNSTTTSNFTSN